MNSDVYDTTTGGTDGSSKLITSNAVFDGLSTKANSSDVYKKTETLNTTEINNAITTGVSNINLFEVVTSLPTSNIKGNKFYLTRNTTNLDKNLYDIYIYVNNKWEKIDSLEFNISDYIKKIANNTNIVLANGNNISQSTFAIQNHKSSNTTYGVGDSSNYGHLKLDTSLNDNGSNPVTGSAIKTYVDTKFNGIVEGTVDLSAISNAHNHDERYLKTGNGTVSFSNLNSSSIGGSSDTSNSKLVVCNDTRLSNPRTPLFNKITADANNIKDLNTYRTGGFYYCESDAQSKYIIHCPNSNGTSTPYDVNKSFFLLVETWGASNNNYVKQTLTYYDNNKTYVRTKTGNADVNTHWKDWVELSKDTDTTYTADESTLTKSSANVFSLKDSSNYIKKSSTTGFIKNDGSIGQANNYSHPSTHSATMITDANAHTNIGSTANANQGTINTAIDTALSNKQAKGSYASSTHNHSGTYVDGVGTKNSSDGSAIAEIKANSTVKGTVYHPKVNSSAPTSYPDGNKSPSFGGSFDVSAPTVNTDGHVTGIVKRTITLPNLPSSHPTTFISNDQKYNNIKSGESTTLTLTTQKLINDNINTVLGNKVDKVSGKGLSTNDFSATYKTNVDNLVSSTATTKNAHVHGNITSDGKVTTTTTNVSRVLVTDGDVVKSISKLPSSSVTHQDISGKVDKVSGKGLSTNDFTATYKTNLDNLVSSTATTKNAHVHGNITSDGKVTTTTTNVSRVLVTDGDVVKSISKLPSSSVTHQDISGKENSSNKVTSISSSSTDTQYPSAKAVYGYAQPKLSNSSWELVSNMNATNYYTNLRVYVNKYLRLGVVEIDSKDGNNCSLGAGNNFNFKIGSEIVSLQNNTVPSDSTILLSPLATSYGLCHNTGKFVAKIDKGTGYVTLYNHSSSTDIEVHGSVYFRF